jgi:hypothetical protein
MPLGWLGTLVRTALAIGRMDGRLWWPRVRSNLISRRQRSCIKCRAYKNWLPPSFRAMRMRALRSSRSLSSSSDADVPHTEKPDF